MLFNNCQRQSEYLQILGQQRERERGVVQFTLHVNLNREMNSGDEASIHSNHGVAIITVILS